MRSGFKSPTLAAALFVAARTITPVDATTVQGNTSALVSLGSFTAGSYVITATGLVDLTGPVNSAFTTRPDGAG